MQARKEEKLADSAFNRLDHHYEEQIESSELIVQAISLQNQHLTALTQRYKHLKARQAELQNTIPEQVLKGSDLTEQYTERMKQERNKFLQEALQSKKEVFEQAYRSKKKEKLEEIYMKWQELGLYGTGSRTTNIFTALQDESLLPQLIEHFDHLPGQEDAVQRLRIWLDLAKSAASNVE